VLSEGFSADIWLGTLGAPTHEPLGGPFVLAHEPGHLGAQRRIFAAALGEKRIALRWPQIAGGLEELLDQAAARISHRSPRRRFRWPIARLRRRIRLSPAPHRGRDLRG